MRKNLTTLLTVIGAVTVLVLAANTVALATTGKALIAGKTNTSSKITALSRTTSGVPLKITSKSTANAPLAVNGKGKVTNLNADKLDGLDSKGLRANTYLWTRNVTGSTNYVALVVPVPAGNYVIGYDAQLTGAGSDGNQVGCSFGRIRDAITDRYYGEVRIMSKTGYRASLSGSGLINVKAGDRIEFYCSAASNFTTDAERPIQIFATKTNVLTSGALSDAIS